MNFNVRIQNLRDFTVQICHTSSSRVVGTGVVVSLEGKIITSAYVVHAAGVDLHSTNANEVGVYFPQARGGEQKARRAAVITNASDAEAGMVVLQLIGGLAPLDPEQVAVLGEAVQSERHDCRSLGYGVPGIYAAPQPVQYVTGTIINVVDEPTARRTNPRESDITAMNGAAVLDVERNLIIGIVSTPSSVSTMVAYGAAEATFLTTDLLRQPPVSLPVRTSSLDLRAAPVPQTDQETARSLATSSPGVLLNGAPPLAQSWVRREEIMRSLTADWSDPQRKVTSLIGVSGAGKSTLARHWLEDVLSDRMQRQPDGVFWWNFAERSSVDTFFEGVLAHLSGRLVDTRQYPSSNIQAQVIGAMLRTGSYLFILDGLDVLQYQEGDQYGLLKSADVRDLLRYFAAPGHDSFCLIISQVPILDLLDYTSAVHRDIGSLTTDEGTALLRKLGVQGAGADLNTIVANLRGHVLTLRLMGAYLREQYNGDSMQWRREDGEASIAVQESEEADVDYAIPTPLQRVLHLINGHLDEAAQSVMLLLSAFRTPVDEQAFLHLFGTKPGMLDRLLRRPAYALFAPVSKLDSASFDALLNQLMEYGLLHYDDQHHSYTTHPLIANFYYTLLAGVEQSTPDSSRPAARRKDAGGDRRAIAHTRIKDYYLAAAGDMPRFPTLDDLSPLIEAVHHACRAGLYDEAFQIYWERIEQGERKAFGHQLGAYETLLKLMLEFFPDGDTTQEPQISSAESNQVILDTVGFCLVNLERLGEAAPFYRRKNDLVVNAEDWHNASIGFRNLVSLYINLGDLNASEEAAEDALTLAYEVANKQSETTALVYQAWVHHLRGKLEKASSSFHQAEALQQELDSRQRYLYSQDGVWHAEHLRRTSDIAYARQITQKNLEMCEEYRWIKSISQCRRVLGDMDAAAGQHERARQYYDEALAIARSIAHRPTLVEALLARGRWAARCQQQYSGVPLEAAQHDLSEALGYAIASGYRLYEADIRIGLAWVHHTAGDTAAARADAQCARRMSLAVGYHWGMVDAAQVLDQIG